MAENVSNKELYNIINRAVAKWGCFDNEPADKEMNIFCHKYNIRRQNNPQLNIFEESLPSPEEVETAKQLCSDIQTYREVLDIYADTNEDCSEDFYRRLYQGLNQYAEHITEDNRLRYEMLEQTLQRNLPEFAETVIFNQYKQEMDIIEYLKKSKNPECKTRAEQFFNQILTKKEEIGTDIKDLSASSNKIAFCEKAISMVDCLPQDKYSRSSKFAIKRNLYNLITKTAQDLGESYSQTAQAAQQEANRYQKSIENAKQYANKGHRRLTQAEINKKAFERWWYK